MPPDVEHCTWCGNDVEPSDGYRLVEHDGDRGAVFCRLEHVVPWVIQGAHWQAGEPAEPAVERPPACSLCGETLGERADPAEQTGAGMMLVRHRGQHRIADAFCSVDHLRDWAKDGGRWRT